MTIDNVLPTLRRQHISHGRPLKIRGLDAYDTPVTALVPLLIHEPLLAGVTSISEPFAGAGNLVHELRARGIAVHASDIAPRGCADCGALDFFKMTARPQGCNVLLSNPAYAGAMETIEHAFALEFDVVILLLKLGFLCTADRFDRVHRPGHLRRVHVLAERLIMHDAEHLAAGGNKAAPSAVHMWAVFDRHYRGPATIVPISVNRPGERMPWLSQPHGDPA
jgi:hypothetical protein